MGSRTLTSAGSSCAEWEATKHMKLATLKDSTRDGRLVVVSRDLTRCSEVGHIARTLQAALDDWAHVGPRLARVAQGLEIGAQPSMRFHEHDATAPLPRAYQFADGSAYLNHVELVRQARKQPLPENLATDPLMYQGGSDGFIGPRARLPSSSTMSQWAHRSKRPAPRSG